GEPPSSKNGAAPPPTRRPNPPPDCRAAAITSKSQQRSCSSCKQKQSCFHCDRCFSSRLSLASHPDCRATRQSPTVLGRGLMTGVDLRPDQSQTGSAFGLDRQHRMDEQPGVLAVADRT